jgi:hypothetical protein
MAVEAWGTIGKKLKANKLLLSPSLAFYDVEIVQVSRGDRDGLSWIVWVSSPIPTLPTGASRLISTCIHGRNRVLPFVFNLMSSQVPVRKGI